MFEIMQRDSSECFFGLFLVNCLYNGWPVYEPVKPQMKDSIKCTDILVCLCFVILVAVRGEWTREGREQQESSAVWCANRGSQAQLLYPGNQSTAQSLTWAHSFHCRPGQTKWNQGWHVNTWQNLYKHLASVQCHIAMFGLPLREETIVTALDGLPVVSDGAWTWNVKCLAATSGRKRESTPLIAFPIRNTSVPQFHLIP